MNTNTQSAPTSAPSTEHTNNMPTSEQLQTALQELRTRRDEMSSEARRAKTELDQARGVMRVLRPKSIEEATQKQARFTVLTDAKTALDEEIAEMEKTLEAARAKEKRVRDLKELAGWRSDLEQQKTDLESGSFDFAQKFQAGLDELLDGIWNSNQLAIQIGFSQKNLNLFDEASGWGVGFMSHYLTEQGISPNVVRLLVLAIQDMQQVRHKERNGFQMYNDTPRDMSLLQGSAQ